MPWVNPPKFTPPRLQRALQGLSKLSLAVLRPTLLRLGLVLGDHVPRHVLWDLAQLLLAHDLRPPSPCLVRTMGICDTILLASPTTSRPPSATSPTTSRPP